jgi:hypothetical protein
MRKWITCLEKVIGGKLKLPILKEWSSFGMILFLQSVLELVELFPFGLLLLITYQILDLSLVKLLHLDFGLE